MTLNTRHAPEVMTIKSRRITVQYRPHSLNVTIPSRLAKELDIQKGDKMRMAVSGQRLIMVRDLPGWEEEIVEGRDMIAGTHDAAMEEHENSPRSKTGRNAGTKLHADIEEGTSASRRKGMEKLFLR